MKIKCPHCKRDFEFEQLEDELLEEVLASRLAEEKLAIEQRAYEEAEKVRIASQAKADEQNQLKTQMLEEKIRQMQKALEDANRRGALGNNQQKGEGLELELESQLKQSFPSDEIVEIKKGKAGADVAHIVKNQRLEQVGLVMYECKHAKWQSRWIEKLKADVRASKADFGVLETVELPEGFASIEIIEPHIFVVSHQMIMPFVKLLRQQILSNDLIKSHNGIKDKKMATLYQYLIGPEFRGRIEAMVTSFDKLQKELTKEKKAAHVRWSHQEKALDQLLEATLAMHGDFQGISGGDLQVLEEKTGLFSIDFSLVIQGFKT